MEHIVNLRLSDGVQDDAISALFSDLDADDRTDAHSLHRHYLDTFDWRLYGRSWFLQSDGADLTLLPFDGKDEVHCDFELRHPAFSRDLPDGPLRDALTPLLKARALVQMASVALTQHTYTFRNKRGKQIAHATHTQVTGEGEANHVASYLSLVPVRGYKKGQQVMERLMAGGLVAEQIDQPLGTAIYWDAMAAAGQTPGGYSSKLDFQLDPAMRADEATKVVLRHLAHTVRANEAGMRADIDSEFLHDYRVATRRTRSALSQIQGVFPAEITEQYLAFFRQLGTLTNELRDLDVYLLAEDDYGAMLPPALQSDIVPLFDLLRSRRAAAHAYVVQGLDDPDYVRAMNEWEEFLNQPGGDDPTAPSAGKPIIKVARKRIRKRYRRIVKDGTYILDHTEDHLLHALRIECKKLRYLLEFFTSLFPGQQIGPLVQQLKQLQDNLGEFADLTVQQASLLDLAELLPIDEPRTRRAVLAMGALVDALARRQQVVKAEFAGSFSQFAASENQDAYRAIFGRKSERKALAASAED